MKHIRDPVTGRCAVCESNGVDPSVLHNGIFYPETTPRQTKPNNLQLVDVMEEDFQPSPRTRPSRPQVIENVTPTYVRYPEKPASETAQSTNSTASASQVTFATQTYFPRAPNTPPSPPPPHRRDRRYPDDDTGRYSPEGSVNKPRYTDSTFREPQVWFVGESPRHPRRAHSPSPRRERRRSPSPRETKRARERSLSPSEKWRQKRHHVSRRTEDSYYGNQRYLKSKSSSSCRRCCGVCRLWCSWQRCCMVFWITLLVLLALAALAAAIYFAVAGAQNVSTVEDITLIQDPVYVILGVDQPCRTTVITSPTVPTTPVTTDGVTSDTTAIAVTTTVAPPTTTLILCYDTTTSVVRKGSQLRNSCHHTKSSAILFLLAMVYNLFYTLVF